jgi:hypothetical protein
MPTTNNPFRHIFALRTKFLFICFRTIVMRKRGYILLAVLPALIACNRPDHDETAIFSLLDSRQTGVSFNNELEETHQMNVLEYQDFYSGGGVSVGDIDNDGLSDLFFTGNQVPAKLYKNLGDMQFEDITEQANLHRMGRGWYTGTSMVDLNNDGFLDIYISKSGMEAPDDRANLLYVNNGNGTFAEKAGDFGIAHQGFAVNAAFFDYDRDGDLDMYLVNQGPVKLKSGNARKLRKERHPEAGDVLYENVGGRFVDVSAQAGIFTSVIGFAHGVSVGDVNDDGWEDIFVSNDFFEYDYLYINNRDKTFTETIKNATRHISYYSMGNDLADYNNDGLLDIAVLDMIAEGNRRLYANLGGMNLMKFSSHLENGLHYQYMSNVLHLNNGNNTFSDVGNLAGISKTDWSWAPVFADFDNDGWKDIYITNGIRKDVRNIDWGKFYFQIMGLTGGEHTFSEHQWDMLLEGMPSEPVPNYMFRNNGDLSFEQVMDSWGMDQTSWSNGVAYGDLDNDGDLDLVVNNIDQEAFVYENREMQNGYIRFRFSGPESNLNGLGTKVRIFTASGMQYQQHYLARGYRSSMEPVMHFGLGQDSTVSRVEVTWPDGKAAIYHDLQANQLIDVKYNDARKKVIDQPENPPQHFRDIKISPHIRHDENDMEDFMRAPALPYKLSTLGPALAVGDVNGDGADDFYLGGAFRRSGQLMIQLKSGEPVFQATNEDLWNEERMYEDVGAIFFDLDNDGDLDLYVVSGGSENAPESGMLNDRLYLNDGIGNFSKSEGLIPDVNCSGAVVLGYDFDDDGDTDIFVGGRQVPGKYLFPANTFLLENQGGKLMDVTREKARELQALGMVTGAVWADYDSDTDVDLIVVGEWMPITIFENAGGKFSKVSNTANGLAKSHGWWWSIAANDFDNDGDIDLVAGNMGYNYKFKATKNEPLVAFSGDFDHDDLFDLAMGYYQDGQLYPAIDRGYAVMQNEYIGQSLTTYNEYAEATLYDIYTEDTLMKAAKHTVETLATTYLENLGDGSFQLKPIGNQAQISNVNSIVISDVDEDGKKDLILAGNLYSMDVRTVRNDGSIGLWMKGNGKGDFQPITYQKSGLDISGDVRKVLPIRIADKYFLLVAKNNDFVQLVLQY